MTYSEPHMMLKRNNQEWGSFIIENNISRSDEVI
jgi:hypothetical protein